MNTAVLSKEDRSKLKQKAKGGTAQPIASKPPVDDKTAFLELLESALTIKDAREFYNELGGGVLSEEEFHEWARNRQKERAEAVEKLTPKHEEKVVEEVRVVAPIPAAEVKAPEAEPTPTLEVGAEAPTPTLPYDPDEFLNFVKERASERRQGRGFYGAPGETEEEKIKRRKRKPRLQKEEENPQATKRNRIAPPSPEATALSNQIVSRVKIAEEKWRRAASYKRLEKRTFKVLEELNSIFAEIAVLRSQLKTAAQKSRNGFEKTSGSRGHLAGVPNSRLVKENLFRTSGRFRNEVWSKEKVDVMWSNSVTDVISRLQSRLAAKKISPAEFRESRRSLLRLCTSSKPIEELKSALAGRVIERKDYAALKRVLRWRMA